MLKIEIRSNDVIHIEGYVNAVCRDSRVITETRGQFVEQVKAGVFQKAIENSTDIKLLINHRATEEIGSTQQGNLKLKEDNVGLFACADITNKTIADKARNGELRGWSFGFEQKKQSWGKTDTGLDRRYLEDINLHEVSIIDNTMLPVYIGTSIEMRADEEVFIETRSFESDIEVVDDAKEKRSIEQNKIAYDLLEKEIEILKLKA